MEPQQEALSLENTMWANTVLASQGHVLAMIVYTGKETRAHMNSRDQTTKVGKLDHEINKMSKFLFIFMLVLSFCIIALSGFKGNVVINFFRFVLLLSAIIPISLRVNLDLGKVYYCIGIYNDPDIPGTIPRNSTIPEELGRIQFLLTDKTGTLTCNDMIFKKCNLEFASFDCDSLPEMKQMLVDNCYQRRNAGPLADVAERNMSVATSDILIESVSRNSSVALMPKKRKGSNRDQGCVIRDLVAALGLCHNVTPTFPDAENPNVVEYQASSPDEVALVKFAESMQMRLMERDQFKIVIENPAKDTEVYEILANFPFSSETKRMGIIMRHTATNRIIFYLKGAETVMKDKVHPTQRLIIEEACDDLANQGLRTLVIS